MTVDAVRELSKQTSTFCQCIVIFMATPLAYPNTAFIFCIVAFNFPLMLISEQNSVVV